jgi:hypothetical protein
MSKMDFAARVLPKGFQVVSEDAIKWLYDNYPEAYQGFYDRVSGLTPRVADGSKWCGFCNRNTDNDYLGACAVCHRRR